jgi:hypothetical protein
MKYFVNAVTKAVIERHLVEPLPDLVLSPLVVTEMAEHEVAFVAAGPAEVTPQRAYLDNKRGMLEKGISSAVWLIRSNVPTQKQHMEEAGMKW